MNIVQIVTRLAVDRGTYGEINYDGYSRICDLYVLVTFRPDSADVFCSGESLAYDQNGRPLVGHINWNPKNYDLGADTFNFNVGLHAMLHVLGFSADRMLNFRNISTASNDTEILEPYSSPPVKGISLDERDMSLLTTPRVAQVFHEYTGCDTIEGAVLEDQGGATIAGSHWEMSQLMGELMTASVTAYSVLSPFTVAALEDSGWYLNLNYEGLSHTPFSLNKGCDFIEKRCNASWPVGDGYYCSVQGDESCTFDRRATAACDLRTWQSIPEKYQYFPDNKRLGGAEEYADYCPFYAPTYYCDNAPQSEDFYGDKGGSDSRCFMSTLTRSGGSRLNPRKPMCYPHVCYSKKEFAVKVGSYYYMCPSGENLTNILSYNGTIECGDASVLCNYATVKNDFPVFLSVKPEKAESGTTVRIYGKNLRSDTVVALGAACEDRSFNQYGEYIECTVKGYVGGKKNIILKQGKYSLVVTDVFELEIATDWWFMILCGALSALVLLLVIIIVTCKCCTTSKKWKKYQQSQKGAAQRQNSAAQSASASRNEFAGDVEFDNMA